MKKMAFSLFVILIAIGAVLAVASGTQVPTADKEKPVAPQNDTAKCVRAAVIDSQRAFKLSKEGRKLLAVMDRLSKKKAEEETGRIRTEMIAIIKEIAKEQGYSLIFDLSASGIICFLEPVDDITNELIERYNSSKR